MCQAFRPARQDSQEVEQRTTPDGFPLYLNDDRFVCTPPNFLLNRSKMKLAQAWDLWWGIGYPFMPMRAIIHSDFYRPHLYHGHDKKVRSSIKSSVWELKVVMSFIEQHGKDTSLASLIELVSNYTASRNIVQVRDLAKALWASAWAAICEKYRFTSKRVHDTQRCALRTLYLHIQRATASE